MLVSLLPQFSQSYMPGPVTFSDSHRCACFEQGVVDMHSRYGAPSKAPLSSAPLIALNPSRRHAFVSMIDPFSLPSDSLSSETLSSISDWIDPFALPSESLSSADGGHDLALLFRSTFSLLAGETKNSPDWWWLNDESWQALTGSVDETLGAAKQSSIVTIDYKINLFFAIFCGCFVRSARNFATVRDELRPISTKFRRQLLERSVTEVDVSDRTTVVTLTAPTQLPGLTEDSITLGRYLNRVLVLKYDHDGIKYEWFVDLPAGKMLADDSDLSFICAAPTESKQSAKKNLRWTLTLPLGIDAPWSLANAFAHAFVLPFARARASLGH